MSSPMALVDPLRPARVERVRARIALRLAIWLGTGPVRRTLTVCALAHRITHRDADHAEAAAASAAVAWAGRHSVGRVACLELALATVILCALRGRSVRFCLGARLMPYAAHAWVEVPGARGPLGATPDHPYLTLIRVPEEHNT